MSTKYHGRPWHAKAQTVHDHGTASHIIMDDRGIATDDHGNYRI